MKTKRDVGGALLWAAFIAVLAAGALMCIWLGFVTGTPPR